MVARLVDGSVLLLLVSLFRALVLRSTGFGKSHRGVTLTQTQRVLEQQLPSSYAASIQYISSPLPIRRF
jgi:hypothetical protein